MATIAFIGLGNRGSGTAASPVRAGHAVRAQALANAGDGARVFSAVIRFPDGCTGD